MSGIITDYINCRYLSYFLNTPHRFLKTSIYGHLDLTVEIRALVWKTRVN